MDETGPMTGSDLALIVTASGGAVIGIAGVLSTYVQSRWDHQDEREETTRKVLTERDAARTAVERLEDSVAAKTAESAFQAQTIARLEAEVARLMQRVGDLERLLYGRGVEP